MVEPNRTVALHFRVAVENRARADEALFRHVYAALVLDDVSIEARQKKGRHTADFHDLAQRYLQPCVLREVKHRRFKQRDRREIDGTCIATIKL